MTRDYVLDANALFRFLTRGPGAETVIDVFDQALVRDTTVMMSAVNWGEVFYALARGHGFDATRRIMSRASTLPLTVVPVDAVAAELAAQLKAAHGLPYADCFAAALAYPQAVVVTADAKDFRRIPGLEILALPPHKTGR